LKRNISQFFRKGKTLTLKMTLIGMVVLGVAVLAGQVSAQDVSVLRTEKEKTSYAIGVDMGRNLKLAKVELDVNSMASGLKDMFSGGKLDMTGEDLQAALLVYQNEMNRKEVEVKSITPNVAYAVGVDTARNLKRQGIELDADFLVRGLREAFLGEKLLMPDSELRKSENLYQIELKQKRNQARAVLARERADQRKKGEAFLAKNRTNEGVVTLPSGLQYKILKPGDGKKPTEADTVEVNYRGIFINGTEFDGSKPGQPATFEIKKVIPGWREALKLMPVGAKWQLFIPSELAYGAQGKGEQIGPYATLIFEVELISVK